MCSAMFQDIASVLEWQGEDPFRVRAYRRAAQTLASLGEPLRAIARRGALETLPGVGKTLSREMQEFLDTGHIRYYEYLMTTVPDGIVPLLRLPGLLPVQVRTLWQTHDITSMKQLTQAFYAGRLPFDPATLERLGTAIAAWEREQYRMLLGVALPRAAILCARLARLPLVEQVSIAGSLRRGTALVGDINLVIASPDPPRVIRLCNQQPEIRQVLETDPTSTLVLTSEGLRVSLMAVLPPQFASALHSCTGSTAHMAALRSRAQQRSLDLTPYGIRQLHTGQYLPMATEEAIYEHLGLPWIAPELREDCGEIEAAEAQALPALLTLDDIRGDLHVQSDWGHGTHNLAQIAHTGQRLGYQYVAICDYAAPAATDQGMTPAKLAVQIAAIQRLNATLPETFRFLTGLELELTPDGALDFDTALLQELDLVIATAHTGLQESRQRLTRRLCKAMEHPLVDILAHPTGRMLGRQTVPTIDMAAVLDMAVETGTVLEINSHVLRLDLSDTYIRQARDLGITLALGSEAQSIQEMRTMSLGVLTARRGWLGPEQVLNTLSYRALLRRWQDWGVSYAT
jgi:DNA polymerase (family 10)